jgi:hypothetical protein
MLPEETVTHVPGLYPAPANSACKQRNGVSPLRSRHPLLASAVGFRR